MAFAENFDQSRDVPNRSSLPPEDPTDRTKPGPARSSDAAARSTREARGVVPAEGFSVHVRSAPDCGAPSCGKGRRISFGAFADDAGRRAAYDRGIVQRRSFRLAHHKSIVAILVIQVFCGVFLIGKILLTPHVEPLDLGGWLEIVAAFGLFPGVFLGARLLRDTLARSERAEERLAELSGAFLETVNRQFSDWGLTAAERDVAFCLVKGLSTLDIAGLRKTSEGTVKAQMNAVYRKARVANRAQLVSLFIDDLLQGDLPAAKT
jgi:DNA-binding CsgD family transcriptional regulator